MGKIFGCFGVLLMFPIFVIGMILFNSWYLQVIYNIGLTPILSQFGLFLPQLGFWIFVLIDVTSGAIKYFFTNINTEKSETEKKTDPNNPKHEVEKKTDPNNPKHEVEKKIDPNNPKHEAEKKTYNVWDKDQLTEGVSKVFSPIISNILTKLLQLGLLAIAFNICF